MTVIIIEDEKLAAERLTLLLHAHDKSINILATFESIEDSVIWLQSNEHPDLFLMDIHLADGHCFEIFNQVKITSPVIFTTAFDNYALDAFKYYSIDYILKPVTSESLSVAMNKFEMVASGPILPDYAAWANKIKEVVSTNYKTRFLAKVGQRTFFIQTDDVAYFYADNKTTFLVDKDGNKFIIHFNIDTLVNLLDPHNFFRINRKIIIHSKRVSLIKPYLNNRLKVVLKEVKEEDDFVVSRDRVASFRNWAEG